jgi:hypothetical protein
VTNELKVLRVDTKLYFWQGVKTIGKPPLARYQHTMNFFKPARLMFIYGGCNDQRNIRNHCAYYNHIAVLDLMRLAWCSVNVLENFAEKRCLHVSTFVNSKLILFGGINFKGFLKPNISYIEVNKTKIETLKLKSFRKHTN